MNFSISNILYLDHPLPHHYICVIFTVGVQAFSPFHLQNPMLNSPAFWHLYPNEKSFSSAQQEQEIICSFVWEFKQLFPSLTFAKALCMIIQQLGLCISVNKTFPQQGKCSNLFQESRGATCWPAINILFQLLLFAIKTW